MHTTEIQNIKSIWVKKKSQEECDRISDGKLKLRIKKDTNEHVKPCLTYTLLRTRHTLE